MHALAFGYWLPLNILLTFALCAVAVYAAGQRRWIVLVFVAAVLPLFVDYQWAGVGFVLLTWWAFVASALAVGAGIRRDLLVQRQPVGAGGDSGGTGPVSGGVSGATWRWAFYGYYVAHLAFIAGAYTAAMNLRRYLDVHYWVARWMDRAFRASRLAIRAELSPARFAWHVLPAAWNSPERNASYAANLFAALLDLPFCLLSPCALRPALLSGPPPARAGDLVNAGGLVWRRLGLEACIPGVAGLQM